MSTHLIHILTTERTTFRTTVSFESVIPPESPFVIALRLSAHRGVALSSFRPSHVLPPSSSPPFPSYTISAESATLPFPPLGRTGPSTSSPDLKEKDKDKAPSGKSGRYPFASLFASVSPSFGSSSKVPVSPRPSSPPLIDTDTDKLELRRSSVSPSRSPLPPSPRPASPKMTVSGFDGDDSASIEADGTSEGFHVTAYTIVKPIRSADVQKAIAKAVRAFVREELARLPDKVVDRVLKLVTAGVCPTSSSAASQELFKSHTTSNGDADVTSRLDFSHPVVTSEKLQDLMEGVYDELVTYYRADSSHIFADGTSKRRTSTAVQRNRGSVAEEEGEAEKNERRARERKERDETIEREASEGTERVEGLISRLLYNR